MTERKRNSSVLSYKVFLEMPAHVSEVYITQVKEKNESLPAPSGNCDMVVTQLT